MGTPAFASRIISNSPVDGFSLFVFQKTLDFFVFTLYLISSIWAKSFVHEAFNPWWRGEVQVHMPSQVLFFRLK